MRQRLNDNGVIPVYDYRWKHTLYPGHALLRLCPGTAGNGDHRLAGSAEAEAFSLEGAVDPQSPLSERDQQMLALERSWWKYSGAKEQAIRDLFGMSATSYYQVLNALIDTEDALAHDPMLVKRLRRLRTTRQRARTARRMGTDA